MKRILVVDDDAIIRQILRSVLEAEGYEVYELESGRGVVDLVKTHNIDLIVLDIYMDQQEGIETLMLIREVFETLPIVIMSSSQEFFEIALDIGANKTLQKPFEPAKLLEMVHDLIK